MDRSDRDFLESRIALPQPDTLFTPKGVTGSTNILQGFPDACLKDRRFSDFSNRLEVRNANLTLMEALLNAGGECGWLGATKRPLTDGNQGFSTNYDFLLNIYNVKNPYFLGLRTDNTRQDGFVVFDMDNKEGKHAVRSVWEYLEKNGYDPLQGPIVFTMSGGIHLYFKSKPEIQIGCPTNFREDIFGPGVDVRGKTPSTPCGGLSVAPGSAARINGVLKAYTVLNNAPIPPLPDCLAGLFTECAENGKGKKIYAVPPTFNGKDELDALCAIMEAAKTGERHDTLLALARRCAAPVAQGKYTVEEVVEKLSNAALKTGYNENLRGNIMDGLNWATDNGVNYRSNLMTPKGQGKGIADSQSGTAWQPQYDPQFDPRYAEAYERDRSFRPGRATYFAEKRNGRPITKSEIKRKIDYSLPAQLSQAIFTCEKEYTLDAASNAICSCVAAGNAMLSARYLVYGNSDNDCTGANLYALLIGSPGSGKTQMLNLYLEAVKKRQSHNFATFMKKIQKYAEELAQWVKKKDSPRPERPVLETIYVTDTTSEAAAEAVSQTPKGTWINIDEGSGQLDFGGARYNPNGVDDATTKAIKGWDADQMSITRKSHDGTPRVMNIPCFTLGGTLGVQPAKLSKTVTQAHEDQGYIQRFLFIPLPSKPEGKEAGPVKKRDETSRARYHFINEWMYKLLDLRVTTTPNGEAVRKVLSFTDEARELFNQWHESLTEAANFGSLSPYIKRLSNNVMRLCLIMHYMHLAAHCAEYNLNIEDEEEKDLFIQAIDVKRAIEIADLLLLNLDNFLWMFKKKDFEAVPFLDEEQQKFAKHVISNPEFYSVPRGVREILDRGFETDKDPKDFAKWLKKQGFEQIAHPTKAHRAAKYMVGGLKPWANSITLSRLVFDDSEQSDCAATISNYRAVIESSGNEVGIAEFAEWMGCDGEDDQKQVREILSKCGKKLGLSEAGGAIRFSPETFEVCEKILRSEGALPGKELAEVG